MRGERKQRSNKTGGRVIGTAARQGEIGIVHKVNRDSEIGQNRNRDSEIRYRERPVWVAEEEGQVESSSCEQRPRSPQSTTTAGVSGRRDKERAAAYWPTTTPSLTSHHPGIKFSTRNTVKINWW